MGRKRGQLVQSKSIPPRRPTVGGYLQLQNFSPGREGSSPTPDSPAREYCTGKRGPRAAGSAGLQSLDAGAVGDRDSALKGLMHTSRSLSPSSEAVI